MTFKKMPRVGRLYRQLIFSSKSKLTENTVIPDISYSVDSFQIDIDHLNSYKELCFFSGSQVPITYPYALAGPLHLAVIVDKKFPLKAAGLLHLRNYIETIEPLDTLNSLKLSVRTLEWRFRPQGLEFDIITEVVQNEKLIWTCTSTLLKKGKLNKEDSPSPLEKVFNKLQPENSFDVEYAAPKNIGRQYAKLSKDYNPIHVSVIMAKLFGYKRSLAHGMWTAASALGKMQVNDIRTFDLAFKGPVFTGDKVKILKENKNVFNIFSGTNKRPVILGLINKR